MNELAVASRFVILYVGAWALIAAVPAFAWSEPRRRRSGRTLKEFLKLELRIIVRGHKLLGIGLFYAGFTVLVVALAPVVVVLAVALVPVVVVLAVIGLVLIGIGALLCYVVLVLIYCCVLVAAVAACAFLLYWWSCTTIAVLGAFIRWDLPTLVSHLTPSYLGLTSVILLPPLLYAAWRYREGRIEAYWELKRKQRRAREAREERRRRALEPPPVEPIRLPPPPPPPSPQPPRPRTVMEVVHPELVSKARPAGRRTDRRIVRRPIPRPEDRPETVTWDDVPPPGDPDVTAFAEMLDGFAPETRPPSQDSTPSDEVDGDWDAQEADACNDEEENLSWLPVFLDGE